MQLAGIYRIDCSNGKFYIGSSVNLSKRWVNHKAKLRKGTHANHHLQNTWNLLGQDAFKFSILELCSIENLIEVEQKWIDLTDCCNPEIGFNLFKKAGRIWDGDSRKSHGDRISTALRGKLKSKEHRAALAQSKRTMSDEKELELCEMYLNGASQVELLNASSFKFPAALYRLFKRRGVYRARPNPNRFKGN
jgi:group I intron endonuclease